MNNKAIARRLVVRAKVDRDIQCRIAHAVGYSLTVRGFWINNRSNCRSVDPAKTVVEKLAWHLDLADRLKADAAKYNKRTKPA